MSKKAIPEPVVPLAGLSLGGMTFSDSPPPPRASATRLPYVGRVTTPSANMMQAICGGTYDEPTLTMVGGLGSDHVLVSSDGETFTTLKTQGRGLRAIVRDGDQAWLCGEYGTLYRAPADLSSFSRIILKTQSCLHGLAKTPGGVILVGGDQGFLARSTDGGETFEQVSGLSGTVRKLLSTDDGVLVPTAKGVFVIHEGGEPEKLAVGDINMVVRTQHKTLIAVCNKNVIRRSTNNGRTWKPAVVPEWQPVEMPPEEQYPRPSWVSVANDLNVVQTLGDGRIVVGGDGGVVLASLDDGETFQRIEHKLAGGSFWGVGRWHGSVYLGGENSIVLRVY